MTKTKHLRGQDTSRLYRCSFIDIKGERQTITSERKWNTYSMLSEKAKSVFRKMLIGGCPYSSIRKVFNLSSEQVVSSKRRDLGIPPREKGRIHIVGPYATWSNDHKDLVAYLYRQGIDLPEIAQAVGRSEGSVRVYIKDSGVRRVNRVRFG